MFKIFSKIYQKFHHFIYWYDITNLCHKPDFLTFWLIEIITYLLKIIFEKVKKYQASNEIW